MKITISSVEHLDWEWVDVVNPSVEELRQIAMDYQLHPASVQDSLEPEHLPKFEHIDDKVFIITRISDPQATPISDSIQGVSRKIAIFYTPKCLITIHRTEQPALDELRQRYVDSGRAQTTLELLCRLLKQVFRSYEPPANKLELELDFYESQIFKKEKLPPLPKGLYDLKRRASINKRVLNFSLEILEGMEEQYPNEPIVRDVFDYFVRIENMYDQINESVNHLLNIYLSLSSHKTNEVMRILTIFSVFFMPLTFIVGIYGMNFHYMPELTWRYGYPAVIILMVVVTAVVFVWFKRKRWL